MEFSCRYRCSASANYRQVPGGAVICELKLFVLHVSDMRLPWCARSISFGECPPLPRSLFSIVRRVTNTSSGILSHMFALPPLLSLS